MISFSLCIVGICKCKEKATTHKHRKDAHIKKEHERSHVKGTMFGLTKCQEYLRSLIVSSFRVDTYSWPLGHAVLGNSSEVMMPRTSANVEMGDACVKR